MKTDTLKIGDKVYCYKDRLYSTVTNEFVHTKNKTYIITDIKKDTIFITTDIKEWNNSGRMKAFPYNNKKNKMYYYFNDYFITKQELRKLKLDKINHQTR